MEHLVAESRSQNARRRLLAVLGEHHACGYRDPEMLYLGARYAVSLGNARVACVFLDELTKLICTAERTPSSFIPVGLLYLRVLPVGKRPPGFPEGLARAEVLERLTKLTESAPRLKALVRNVALDPNGPRSVAGELLENARKADWNGIAKPGMPEADSPPCLKHCGTTLQALARLATESSDAYTNNELSKCRLALEEMLLIDGDQPPVLRNLITIASEQRDIEAYERYWRRYVTVLLWRILRGDDRIQAYEDLTRFFVRAALLLDRECGRKPNEMKELLSAPGFLERWIEVHAGLVWLDALGASHRQWQTQIPPSERKNGRLGSLAIFDFWFRTFYPQFLPFIDSGTEANVDMPPLPVRQGIGLPFDPVERIFKRCLDWTKTGFAPEGRR